MPKIFSPSLNEEFARCVSCGALMLNVQKKFEPMGLFKCSRCFGAYEQAPRRVAPLNIPRSGPYRTEVD